jgi:hypothetical protein
MTTIIIISRGPNAEQNVEVVNNDTTVDTDTLTQAVQQALNQAQ